MQKDVKSLMYEWPTKKPKREGEYLIWIRGSGFQITTYGRVKANKENKEPYFHWCGSPKKVLWLALKGNWYEQ